MFSCFGSKKKKKIKILSNTMNNEILDLNDSLNSVNSNRMMENNNNDVEIDEQKLLAKNCLKLEIDKDNLLYSNEIYQKEIDFLDNLINMFKNNINNIDNENPDEETIKNILEKENDILKDRLNNLEYEEKKSLAKYSEVFDMIEKLSNPKFSNKAKYEQDIFILENKLKYKENLLKFYHTKYENLKKYDKDDKSILIEDYFLNNNEPKNNNNLDIESNNSKSSSSNDSEEESEENSESKKSNSNKNNNNKTDKKSNTTKKNNNNNNNFLEDGNTDLIKKIISEDIENNRNIYQQIYKTAMFETFKLNEEKKILEKIKKDIDSIKNPEKKIKEEKKENEEEIQEKLKKKKKEEEKQIYKEKIEQINKNKITIMNLNNELDKTNLINKEIEEEVNQLYTTLSEKIKNFNDLEKEIKNVKNLRKKAAEEISKFKSISISNNFGNIDSH
jgi:hypothetical protein